MLLFVLLASVSCRAEEIDMVFTTLDNKVLPIESVPSSSDLAVTFKAFGREFRLALNDSSLKVNGVLMRQNLCDFSVTCLYEEECYGSMSFCNSIYGSFVSSGVMYQIKSTEDGKVEIEELGRVSAGTQEHVSKKHPETEKKRVIKIFLINDYDRVQEIGPDINLDTIEIFRNAKDIFEGNKWNIRGIELSLNGILNVVDRPLIQEPFSRLQELEMIKNRGFNPEYIEKADSIRMLNAFSRTFGSASVDTNAGEFLKKSNLILLLQTSSIKVNGLTFVGGVSSATKRFGVIRISELDSYFYKGKVMAHEIAHGLGAEHEADGECLMREEESPLEKEEHVSLGHKAIEAIESFILGNESKFGDMDTCGNGVMGEGKECDSGLPNGSICCTKRCKLRPWARCDDRNGRCCRDCGLLPKNAMCKEKSSNVHKMDCEKGSYCNGESPECRIRYAKDGSRPIPEGVCKRGVLQTEALMCERVGKFFNEKCPSKDGNLWCLDQYDVCSPVFTSLSLPIKLPVLKSQKAVPLTVIESRPMLLLIVMSICLLVASKFIVPRR
ncbi:hypothetical protein KMI_03g04750 [Encephalitozoon hellem]|nr:hypothetical protein KMI_03g04750 [Encephalitozoon hellem]